MKSSQVQISFRLEEELRTQFDVKLAQERRDKTSVLVGLVQRYVGGESDVVKLPAGGFTQHPGRVQRYHEALDRILESGNAEAAAAITNLLKTLDNMTGGAEKTANENAPTARRKSG